MKGKGEEQVHENGKGNCEKREGWGRGKCNEGEEREVDR